MGSGMHKCTKIRDWDGLTCWQKLRAMHRAGRVFDVHANLCNACFLNPGGSA